MFAVIGTETVPGRSPVARAAERMFGKDRLTLYEDVSVGARFLRADIVFTLDMRETEKLKLVRRALALVSSAGARGVILPSDFSYAGELVPFGLAAADPVPLYRRMAGKMASYAIKKSGANVSDMLCAILSRRLTNAVEQAAREICLSSRYVALCCGQDTSSFCRDLARSYGASVLENPSVTLIKRAELVLVFDMPKDGLPEMQDDAVVILLCGDYTRLPKTGIVVDGARFTIPQRLMRFLPDCETYGFLSALIAEGALREGELEVEALTFGKTPVI